MPLSHVPRPESRAAILSFVVSVVLLLIKFAAYFVTGSAAIFSDAMESVVNVAASVMARARKMECTVRSAASHCTVMHHVCGGLHSP